MPPRAPCPLCSMKKADDTQKALFSVEGPSNTEHDPVIPDEYFKMPPTKLGGVGIESEALRVSRYCYVLQIISRLALK